MAKTINEKLTKVQTELKSKKSRYNSFGKYYFRSAEDILEAIKPFLKELSVTVTINEELFPTEAAPVMQVTATLYKASFDQQAVVPNGVYSCMITNVLSEKGKNTINPTYKNSYFTMFSSAGNSINSDDLESMG